MKAVLLVCASLVFFTAGEAASKMWANNPRWPWAALVVACYMAGSLVWLPAILSKNHLTSLGTFWNVGALICTVAVGVLFFHEKVTAVQWVGILLALAASVLLSL